MKIEHPSLTHLTLGFIAKDININVNCPEVIDFNLLNRTIENGFIVSCPKARIHSTVNCSILFFFKINHLIQIECNEFLLQCKSYEFYAKFNLKVHKKMENFHFNFYQCEV